MKLCVHTSDKARDCTVHFRAKARDDTVSGRASDRMVPDILLFRNPHWGLHATWMNCSRLMYTYRDPFELFAASVNFSPLA